MNEFTSYGNAIELVGALVEARMQYDELVAISKDETYPESERFEAEELTKDGFYRFIANLMKMSGKG